MGERVFHYCGSDNPVRVGDRISVRGWFGRARLATVVYIPGQTAADSDLGDDQWAYKRDDGGIYATGYDPERLPDAGKRIQFVCRAGDEAQEVVRSYRIPPEQPGRESGRDLLALIGRGTLIVIAVALCIVVWRTLTGGG